MFKFSSDVGQPLIVCLSNSSVWHRGEVLDIPGEMKTKVRSISMFLSSEIVMS